MKNNRVGIIGSGNMAFSLGKELLYAGFTITEVYSRNKREGKKLSVLLKADYVPDPAGLKGNADLYLICLQDDAIGAIIKQLPVEDKIVVHTSGAVPMNVFKGYANKYGVLYPVQSINKNVDANWKEIPLCIEANDSATKKQLTGIAKKISQKIFHIDSEQRKHLHVAAVFANNFSNACFTMAKELLDESHLSFDLMRPLILHTATKIQTNNPLKVQTGPAIRNDVKVLKEHRKLLKDHPELKKVYEVMTNFIQHTPQ